VQTLALDDLTDVSMRAHWTRHRRILIPIIVAVLAVGAFLQWGPVGLGNGPLHMGMGLGTEMDGGISSRLPVAIIAPIGNSGGSALVIDGVQLLGNASYPAPHVLAMDVISDNVCADLSPTRTTTAGFVLTGCSARPLGSLYGRAVGNENSYDGMAAFEVRPPRPGACWLVTRIVTHYHVGIRHYVATDPYVVAVCAGSHAKAEQILATAGG
jgi:hypothetical protein